MCLTRRNLTPKARRFLAAGNLCLFTSVVMPYLGKELGIHHPELFDGLRGLLLGLAICFNFWAFRLGRNCTGNQA
jgi:hypothetical protein